MNSSSLEELGEKMTSTADFPLDEPPATINFGKWEDHTVADVLDRDPGYMEWVADEFEDPSDYIRSEVEQMKKLAAKGVAKARLEDMESCHVGKEGWRDVFDVCVENSHDYVRKGKRERVVVMRDKDDNRITYFTDQNSRTSRRLNSAAPENKDFPLRISAEVVEHKKYDGEKDTVVTSTEVVKRKIGERSRESPPKGESFRKKRLDRLVDDFYGQWQDVFRSRIRKFVVARRQLKEKPFSEDAMERLEQLFHKLLDTYYSKKETATHYRDEGFGHVQGDPHIL